MNLILNYLFNTLSVLKKLNEYIQSYNMTKQINKLQLQVLHILIKSFNKRYTFNFQLRDISDKYSTFIIEPKKSFSELKINTYNGVWNCKNLIFINTRPSNEKLQYFYDNIGYFILLEIKNNIPFFNYYTKPNYNCIYEGCRFMDCNFLWWFTSIYNIINISCACSNNLINSSFVLSMGEEPIIHEDNIHPFYSVKKDIKYFRKNNSLEYNCYNTTLKKNYKDTLYPMCDMIMFLFNQHFSNDFSPIYNSLNKDDWLNKQNKVVFRGSLTGCNIDDFSKNIRILAHIKSLQHSDLCDCYLTKGLYFNYFGKTIEIKDLPYFPANKLTIHEQINNYKYVLQLDGFVSAWRIIQLIYSGCLIIKPNSFLIKNSPYKVSPFTDIIDSQLKPWIHYVPVEYDLSNLINTIQWCNNNPNICFKIIKNCWKIAFKYFSREKIIKNTIIQVSKPYTSINYIPTTYTPEYNNMVNSSFSIKKDSTKLLNKSFRINYLNYSDHSFIKSQTVNY